MILSRHLEQVTDRDTQTGLFSRSGLYFFRSPGCVAEWEETCWSLTVLTPHAQGFPGRSDTHKQAHSIPEDMLDRRDRRLPGNSRPLVIAPFVVVSSCNNLVNFSSANRLKYARLKTNKHVMHYWLLWLKWSVVVHSSEIKNVQLSINM